MGDGGDQIVKVLKLHTIEKKLSFHICANEIMKKSEISSCVVANHKCANHHKKNNNTWIRITKQFVS